MKKNISVTASLAICILFISMIACYENSGAADSSSIPQGVAKSGSPVGGDIPAGGGNVPNGPNQELAGTYLIDILSPDNAGDKTLYIKDPKGKISATWECTEHGHQVLTNVSFNGEVLTFNALSGTPGDEYFYYHLEFYGDHLLGYCKTQDGWKSPVLATAIK